jgi:hypothetical protein
MTSLFAGLGAFFPSAGGIRRPQRHGQFLLPRARVLGFVMCQPGHVCGRAPTPVPGERPSPLSSKRDG